ncbi:MAG: hypothetical protein ACREFF_14620 [Candidatus Udaeobacter sp.]
MTILSLLRALVGRPLTRAIFCVAVCGFTTLPAIAENDVTPSLAGVIRYHFRERLEGVKPGGKQYSAPAYETEQLPPSSAPSDKGQVQVIKGKVAHLPYSFLINLGGKGPGTLEVKILTADGKPLRGYPKTVANAFAQGAEATSQDFEIPVTPKLKAKIEKGLLEKNQHLTQVQLIVQTSQ